MLAPNMLLFAAAPGRRWLSGSFAVVDPAAKLFTNSRVQV